MTLTEAIEAIQRFSMFWNEDNVDANDIDDLLDAAEFLADYIQQLSGRPVLLGWGDRYEKC